MISVIIPAYNVEKYIERCINSILNQTYKNFEIIIIDDGSNDNTFNICQKLSQEHINIKIMHQKNKGVSASRNLGLKISTGEFVLFVDADDYLENNMLEILLKQIDNSDLAVCSYIKENENDNSLVFCNNDINFQKKYMKDEFVVEVFRNKKICGFLWNKLFNMQIIRTNNITFEEKIYICEDLCFLIEYLQFCQKAINVSNMTLYHYVQRSNSALNRTKNEKWFSILDSYEKMIKLNHSVINKNIMIFYYLKILSEAMYYYKKTGNQEEYRIQKNKFKKYIKEINKKYLNMNEKIKYLILRINYRLFIYLKIGGK